MRIAGTVAALALASVVCIALGGADAHADASKAWAAARANLPADTKLVIAADFAAIQKTQMFATFYPKLRDKPDFAKMVDTLKTSCKLDPLTAVQGIVVGTNVDQSAGAVYIGVTGVDKAKLGQCLQAAAAADKGTKLTIKQDGDVTELTDDGGKNAFIGWSGKDVMVVAFPKADDKAALATWMGGKGALGKSMLGKTLAKLNTAAAIWGAGDANGKELQPGVVAKQLYGAVTYKGGTLSPDIHAVLSSAKDAKAFADQANQQLASLSGGGAGLPPAVVTMLSTVKITSANDEVVIKASVAEQDLMGILAMAMGGGGSP